MHQIKVTVHDLSRGGSGVARLPANENETAGPGEIVFIPFTAPGDEVSIKILKKEKNFSQGELIEVIHPSSFRTEPQCKVFGKCGGCSWQHVSYPLQFETKKKGLLHTLKRSGIDTTQVTIENFPAEQTYSYRNRVQLRGIPATQELGFYIKGSLSTVPIERCEIADERINQALPEIRKRGSSEFTSEYKVEVEVDLDGNVRTSWNEKHAAFGFRQVNDAQNLKLQRWISENAGNGDSLLDLFGGDGNLSLALASRFKQIHCVDLNVPNVNPAPHFKFHRSDVLKWLKSPHFSKTHSTVILDPPREGLGVGFKEIEASLRTKFNANRILLVGCDVDSFAKDVARFIQAGYRLEKLGVLDLFPQTPHVESLALFNI